MITIQVKKLHPDAKIPTRMKEGDIGYDLYGMHINDIKRGVVYIGTGIAISPSDGYYVEIHARSSLHKDGWMLANSVGIIDQGYTGELILALVPIESFRNKVREQICYEEMISSLRDSLPCRLAQLLIRKKEDAEFVIVDELKSTQRGNGGLGSTGK